MNIFKLILLSAFLISASANLAMNNEENTEALHAHDVKFSVFAKNGEQLLAGATVIVLIYNKEMASGISNELGKTDLLVKSYSHQKVTLKVSYKEETKTIKNIELESGKFYYADFAIPDLINAEEAARK